MIQEYKYCVQRRPSEDRSAKMIEANGIEAFERTVSQGISDSYLRWQGINRHPGARSVAKRQNRCAFGSGKDGLPIILGRCRR